MERYSLKWMQEFTMPNKKPPATPSITTRRTTRPAERKNTGPTAANPRPQADNRWQRTKRYGWDSR